MPMLYLIRGLPGSGKSTFAKTLSATHFETDMWMVDGAGNYDFQPSRLAESHDECAKAVLVSLSGGHDVVVSNTFSQRWEMEPYYNMGYPITEIMMLGNFGSIHNVPAGKIEDMRRRWEF